ncbi:MAG: S8 family serine peptidase, partial [Candidatus Poribacteria bacterium]|nr:S8 family serine peptidase [Candidatus Poribacteria bacterium]
MKNRMKIVTPVIFMLGIVAAGWAKSGEVAIPEADRFVKSYDPGAKIDGILGQRKTTKKEKVIVFVVDMEFWEDDGHGTIVMEIIRKHFDGEIRNIDLEVGTSVSGETKPKARQIVDALQYIWKYAVENPETYIVVNMSWGIAHETVERGNLYLSQRFKSLLEGFFKRLSNSDVAFVAAVGNDNKPFVHMPANCEGVIGVASVVLKDGRYMKASYSNYGAGVDIAVRDEPQTILEAYKKSIEQVPLYNRPSESEMRKKVMKMRALRGTSFAAPH